jgi:putative addiction module component (TIGR02574 family)
MESLDLIQDEDVEAAWQEEIARRIEELRTGRAKTVPWTEVRKKAQAILHEETR